LAVAELDSVVVGFAWGYIGEHGQYWPDLVSRSLGAAAAGWVGGHFEFVELAVSPKVRGRGVGGALHDHLLDGVPHQRALLGTSADGADPAVRLYRSRGWRRLGSLGPDVQVMGLRDPGRRVR
jgi:ribosomal protein S18 acetylase RimI-like enzyme